jgi:hypothetical protein
MFKGLALKNPFVLIFKSPTYKINVKKMRLDRMCCYLKLPVIFVQVELAKWIFIVILLLNIAHIHLG